MALADQREAEKTRLPLGALGLLTMQTPMNAAEPRTQAGYPRETQKNVRGDACQADQQLLDAQCNAAIDAGPASG